MKALILTGRLVQDHEFVYPFYRLQEAGYEVDVAVRGKVPCTGIIGLRIEPTHCILDVDVHEYDLLVIPGGVKAMEHMRLDEGAVNLPRVFHAAGRVIACICSGAQLLISAGLVRGRVISAYPAIRVDVENAGGTFHEGPVCDFDRIVTAPHYRDLGPWMAAVLKAVDRERGLQEAQ